MKTSPFQVVKLLFSVALFVFLWGVVSPVSNDHGMFANLWVFPQDWMAALESAPRPLKFDSLAWKEKVHQPAEVENLVQYVGEGNKYGHMYYPEERGEALSNYFEALKVSLMEEGSMRVLHIGDSQLEGDRITSTFRTLLQNRFGGCGIGLFNLNEIRYIRYNLIQEYTDNWNKHLFFSHSRGRIRHKNYPLIGGGYYGLNGGQTGVITFYSPKTAVGKEREAEVLRLFYRNTGKPVRYKLQQQNFSILSDTMVLTDQMAKVEIPLEKDFKKVKLTFFADYPGFELQGMSLDCKQGVSVDNVALRGSAGLEFTNINFTYLQEQLEMWKTKLIILQFGVNVVPKESMKFDFYERSLVRQLRYLKEAAPEVDILVIGVSDMGVSKRGEMVSNTNIPNVVMAQKNAALETGCAFWDLYGAMGGDGSIVKWARADTPLAKPDFTHFTKEGAVVVAEMLHASLMKEYQNYWDTKFNNEVKSDSEL